LHDDNGWCTMQVMKRERPESPALPRKTRASNLLEKLIVGGAIERARVAMELGVDQPTLDAYASGTAPIPLDRQARLAQIAIARTPELAREGHRLLGQARAASSFEDGDTARHVEAPTRFRR
jgi:hypothetical protein